MSAVQLSSLSHRFGRHILLDDLSLNIRSGEYLVILGESGSGKSTLLQMIAGLQAPDSGTVEIDGRDMLGIAPHLRNVSLLFQHDSLYPHLTVRRNVLFGSANIDHASRHWNEVVRLTRIEKLLDRTPDALSGGEKKRVGLAKSLFRKAHVQLLDEPLSAIDPAHRFALTMDLRRIHEASGATAIHVTHDAEEAFRLADRIAVLHDGNICQVDPPETLTAVPSHISVTRLLSVFGSNEFRVRQGGPNADAITIGTADADSAESPRIVIPSSAIQLTSAETVVQECLGDETILRRAGQRWQTFGMAVRIRQLPLGDEIDLTTAGIVWSVRTAGRSGLSTGPVCVDVNMPSTHWFDESGHAMEANVSMGS